MKVKSGSLTSDLAPPGAEELVEALYERPGVRIERIVSTGHASPDGHWYDQDSDEWVLVVAGGARLRIDGEAQDRELARRRLRLPSGPLPPSRRLDPKRAADGVAGDPHVHQMLTGTAESDETTPSM